MNVEPGTIFTCKCADCTMTAEVLTGSCGECGCGDDMKVLPEKTADAPKEKHVPVVEKIVGGFRVVVGSTLHPMADDHWIEWIELRAGNKVYREYLQPGQAPEATFLLEADGDVVAREHCNKHGLWRA